MDFVEAPIGTNGYSVSSVRGRLGLDAWLADTPITGWRYSNGTIDYSQELADATQQSTDNDGSNSFAVVSVSTTELPRIVSLPHGLLSLLFAIFAALPWLHWSKRFTLRTLLIAMMLVAVVLGAIVYAVK